MFAAQSCGAVIPETDRYPGNVPSFFLCVYSLVCGEYGNTKSLLGDASNLTEASNESDYSLHPFGAGRRGRGGVLQCPHFWVFSGSPDAPNISLGTLQSSEP
jgi:hypothetical protein